MYSPGDDEIRLAARRTGIRWTRLFVVPPALELVCKVAREISVGVHLYFGPPFMLLALIK